MPSISAFMPGFDPATGMVSLPWWIAAAALALLAGAIVLAALRAPSSSLVSSLTRLAVLIVVMGAVASLVERTADGERAAERRALETRAFDLAARAFAPGSALACLEGTSGAVVEGACEKALFATPEVVAEAASFIFARLSLLADALEYSMRRDGNEDAVLPGLRRSLEIDRFGFVAQVLTTRYGCSLDRCDALNMFRDGSRIAANLQDASFDAYLARYAGAWPTKTQRPGVPVADAGFGPSPVPPGFQVPSSASIPPVSIMDPEPVGTASNSASGDRGAQQTRRTPPTRARAQQAGPMPLQLGPRTE